MKRSSLLPFVAATAGLAVALSACQKQEDTPDAPAAPAADVTVNQPPNVTVNPPDVNIKAPDVDVDVSKPDGKVTREESTTVDVPGVGSTTTTTVEKK